ncbi:MAG: hypothetical protein CSA64_01625 [Arachnia propionica]|nr:MAG: hypothetical protein CSA64_01625 [Arachnia propionica]
MDHAAQIKEYAPSADPAVVAALLKRYRLVLSKSDSATVAFGDAKELERVRKNFLRKSLGLTKSDEELDAAIAEVGQRLKSTRNKSRAVVYYLLAEKFGRLDFFAS